MITAAADPDEELDLTPDPVMEVPAMSDAGHFKGYFKDEAGLATGLRELRA
jgi:hypothetical protein